MEFRCQREQHGMEKATDVIPGEGEFRRWIRVTAEKGKHLLVSLNKTAFYLLSTKRTIRAWFTGEPALW